MSPRTIKRCVASNRLLASHGLSGPVLGQNIPLSCTSKEAKKVTPCNYIWTIYLLSRVLHVSAYSCSKTVFRHRLKTYTKKNFVNWNYWYLSLTLFKWVLGAFAKLRRATISFVVSVCLSVCPFVRIEQLCPITDGFSSIWYLRIFRKSDEKIQVWLKSDKNKTYFTWRPVYIYITSLNYSYNKKCFKQNL
jgi:hypothetical protein